MLLRQTEDRCVVVTDSITITKLLRVVKCNAKFGRGRFVVVFLMFVAITSDDALPNSDESKGSG